MKSFILTSWLLVAVSASSMLDENASVFQNFKLKHGKQYMNQVEETKRFAIFKDNLRAIKEHNALYEQGLVSYKQAINQFSDKTPEEFKAFLGLHKKPILKTTKFVKKGIAVPASVDWREQGQVTNVQDQGSCGSCWAFAIGGSIEGAYYRKNGKLVSLSKQQLVDCSEVNSGCFGGYLDATFPYIQENGLQSEEDYPYIGVDGSCQYNSSKVVTKVSSYVSIKSEDEDALLEAVATIGPVSVAIDATHLSSYASGIYSDNWCSPQKLNHGVLVVGYGEENDKKYWIVKNSWSDTWGEDGYFRILRGSNECGISEDSVYPLIN